MMNCKNKPGCWGRLEKKEIGFATKGVLRWIKNKNLQQAVRRDYAAAQIFEEEGLFNPAIILTKYDFLKLL